MPGNTSPESASAQVGLQIEHATALLQPAETHQTAGYIEAARTTILGVLSEPANQQLSSAAESLAAAAEHAQHAGNLLRDGIASLDAYAVATGLRAALTEARNAQTGIAAPELSEHPVEASPLVAETQAEAAIHDEVARALERIRPLYDRKKWRDYTDELQELSPEALALLLQSDTPMASEILLQKFKKGLRQWAGQIRFGSGLSTMQLDDLWQAGALDLLQSARAYQPGLGLFSTFALHNAKHAMRHEAVRILHTVRLPENARVIITATVKMNRERELHGQAPLTDAELIEHFDVVPGPPGKPGQRMTVGAIRQALELTYNIIPLDADDQAIHDLDAQLAEEGTPDPSALAADNAMVRDLYRLLDTLPPKYNKWIRLRYGIGADKPHTKVETADLLGLSFYQGKSYDTFMREFLKKPYVKNLLHGYLLKRDEPGREDATYPWPEPHQEEG